MKILSAEYVLPISSEPIENGAVAIEKDKILAVGTLSEIQEKFPDCEHESFGEAVILPGFINVHSHLEITAMRGFLDTVEHDFTAWLLKLTKTRAEVLTDEDVKTAAIFGALEGARAGVTCFGDIGRFGVVGFEALKKNKLRGILFQETEFSPEIKNADADFEKLKEKFLALKETENELVKVGISPHSPYTVNRKLFERIAEYALSENIKITIHVAESNEEVELLQKGTGFFTKVYEKYGVEWNAPFCSPLEFLEKTGILQTKPLLAHCIKVSDSDIEIMRKTDSRVAHCPKSNAKFGHGIAPLEKFLDAEIKIGFGSDSVASNNVCDILEEARFGVLSARNLASKERFIEPQVAIEIATLGGAKSLGLENEIGTLESGKQADLVVVSLENTAQMPVHDVYSALVFASNSRDIKMTMVAGEEIYRNGNSNIIDESEIKIKIKEIVQKMKKA
ncbi:MAG TPA: amidohydrolase family protein [Pyrinomonadaceae bacterium]|nr:amidohydrolase family protein [Pyrinomonadaceae bacterium]